MTTEDLDRELDDEPIDTQRRAVAVAIDPLPGLALARTRRPQARPRRR